MSLRSILFVAVLLLAAGGRAAPSLAGDKTATIALPPADLALVTQAADYLTALKAAKGRFEQTSARGGVTTGDLFIQRPGKARFAYDPPSGLLVVSDGRAVSVWDQRLKTFDRAPLGATPLAILLARQVRLDEDVIVTRVDRFNDGFTLTAKSASGQDRAEGYITLAFAQNPLALRGWTLVDAQGQATKVRITTLEPASNDPALFILRDPRPPKPVR